MLFWGDVETEIAKAVKSGVLVDKRSEMPSGLGKKGVVRWRDRLGPKHVLGVCIHQNGAPNFNDPMGVAYYHTSRQQHVVFGRPLESIAYPIVIPDVAGPPWLCCDLSKITYAQGEKESTHPGDENAHLIAILVMGAYFGAGLSPKLKDFRDAPSQGQIEKLHTVVAWLLCTFRFELNGIFGHYHFGKAACPGYALSKIIESYRDRYDGPELQTATDWQKALLRWHPDALPVYGPDGIWGAESKRALTSFQDAHRMRLTGVQDPFTELQLLRYA